MGSALLPILPGSARKRLRVALGVAVLFGFAAGGCNDTCVSFNSNPPQGLLQVQHPCKVEETSGTVSVRVGAAAPACPSCTGAGSVQHIYVGVEGMDLQLKNAPGQPAQWRQLALPQGQPVQVDLLAPPDDSCAAAALLEGAAPAGVYRAIRLRLAANAPAPETPAPEASALAPGACGPAAYHCMVLAGGRVLPLLLEESLEINFASQGDAEGLLFVFPAAHTRATIRFRPDLAFLHTEAAALRLRPFGTTASASLCPPSADPRQP